MNNAIVEIFEGQQITIRPSDGYWNATEMCKRYDRKFNDFSRTKGAIDYVEALSAKAGIPALELVQVKKGGNRPGVWVHQRVALKLAAWLNAHFEVWVFEVIERLMTQGKVELEDAYDSLLDALDISEAEVRELRARSERLARELSGLLYEYDRDDLGRELTDEAWRVVEIRDRDIERLKDKIRELGGNPDD